MTLAQYVQDLAQFGDELAAVVLPRAAPELVDIALKHARRDTGGSGRMMKFRLDAKATVAGSTLIIRPVPAGPWSVLEVGVNHDWRIGPGDKVLTVNGDFRRAVTHPGIRARRTWTSATDEMDDAFLDIARREATKLWGDVGG